MPTNEQLENQRMRLKAEADYNNPKNIPKPSWFYKPLTKDTSDKYASANLRANMVEQEMEAQNRLPNSIEQYLHEKEQGDPNAVRMSYQEWKKL